MIDIYLLLTLFLLILGIAGSIIPGLPGPVFSIVGVLFYWWSTGYETPGTLLLILTLGTATLALVIDYVASYIGAERAGSSRKTAFMAAVSAGVLFLFTGPLGIILGVAGVVFLREILLGKDADKAFNAAFSTTVALLASTISKIALTTLVVLLFILSLFL